MLSQLLGTNNMSRSSSSKSLRSFTISSYVLRSHGSSSLSLKLINSQQNSQSRDLFDILAGQGSIGYRLSEPARRPNSNSSNSFNSNRTHQQAIQQASQQNTTASDRNLLRFFNDLVKKYLRNSRVSIERQKQWIANHQYPSKDPKTDDQIFKKFQNWVKKLSLTTAKNYREIIGQQGYFQILYRVQCLRFYYDQAAIAIYNHKWSKNQSSLTSSPAYLRKQKRYYIENIWKMLWVIRNPTIFQGLKKIRQ